MNCLLCNAKDAFSSFESFNIALRRIYFGYLPCFKCGVKCSGLQSFVEHMYQCDSVNKGQSNIIEVDAIPNSHLSQCSDLSIGELSISCLESSLIHSDQLLYKEVTNENSHCEKIEGTLLTEKGSDGAFDESPSKVLEDCISVSNAKLLHSTNKVTDFEIDNECFPGKMRNKLRTLTNQPRISGAPCTSFPDSPMDFSLLVNDLNDEIVEEPTSDNLIMRQAAVSSEDYISSTIDLIATRNKDYTVGFYSNAAVRVEQSVDKQHLTSFNDTLPSSSKGGLAVHCGAVTTPYISTSERFSLQHCINNSESSHLASSAERIGAELADFGRYVTLPSTSTSCFDTPLMVSSFTTSTDLSSSVLTSLHSPASTNINLLQAHSILPPSSPLFTSVSSEFSQARLTESIDILNKLSSSLAYSYIYSPSATSKVSTFSSSSSLPFLPQNLDGASFEPAKSISSPLAVGQEDPQPLLIQPEIKTGHMNGVPSDLLVPTSSRHPEVPMRGEWRSSPCASHPLVTLSHSGAPCLSHTLSTSSTPCLPHPLCRLGTPCPPGTSCPSLTPCPTGTLSPPQTPYTSSGRRLRQILQSPSQHACSLCARRFRLPSSLRAHAERVHGANSSGGGGGVSKPLRNDTAAATAAPAAGGLECGVCKRRFTSERRLQRHLDIVHGEKDGGATSLTSKLQKDYTCSVCDGSFSSAYFLRDHSRVHTGDRPHVCDVCGKRFSFAQTLTKHRLYHDTERRHVCVQCGKSFRESATLQNHQLVHTGERPWQCEVCGRRFRQRVTYIVHRRLHTGEMPYICSLCGSSFRYKITIYLWLTFFGRTNNLRHVFDQFEKSQMQCID